MRIRAFVKGRDSMNELTNIFKTLSDETRLRIMMLLYQDELCVCEISGILNVPQPTVSKGLSKLRDLNLVVDTRKEKFVYYKLRTDHILLNSILSDILKSIGQYPQLQEDQKNIATKWQYSESQTLISKNFTL